MANLKIDSPLSRRIVLSFIDFLNSIEAGPNVDVEGLEVAKDCLIDVFKIDPLTDRPLKRDSLVEIFSSKDCVNQGETKSDSSSDCISADAPGTSSGQDVANAKQAAMPEFQDKDWTRETHAQGMPKDDLFGKFFEGLEKVHYFKTLPDGNDDQDQLDNVTRIFDNAIEEMEKSGCQTYDQKNLADNLKSQGNKAMQSKLFTDAIELYTFAIALSDDNAVFFCNRAAAYTQVGRYDEAIRDCLKSIEIDPRYGKAYSRLGYAYYAQGKYKDAIDKGFIQAQKLDPNNESIRENIRAAQEKLNEEHLRSTQHNQNSSTSSHQGNSNQQSAGGSRSRAMPPQFTSFTGNGLPVELTNMLRNFSANVMHADDSQGAGDSAEPFLDPDIRTEGGNINVNLGDQMPGDVSFIVGSVIEMFSGSSPEDNSPENLNERSSPS